MTTAIQTQFPLEIRKTIAQIQAETIRHGEAFRASLDELLRALGPQTAGVLECDIRLREIQTETAKAFGITRSLMLSPSREYAYVRPRQVAMHLAVELLEIPLVTIAAGFGVHHGTVIHARKRIQADVETDKRIAEKVEKLRGILSKPASAPKESPLLSLVDFNARS